MYFLNNVSFFLFFCFCFRNSQKAVYLACWYADGTSDRNDRDKWQGPTPSHAPPPLHVWSVCSQRSCCGAILGIGEGRNHHPSQIRSNQPRSKKKQKQKTSQCYVFFPCIVGSEKWNGQLETGDKFRHLLSRRSQFEHLDPTDWINATTFMKPVIWTSRFWEWEWA